MNHKRIFGNLKANMTPESRTRADEKAKALLTTWDAATALDTDEARVEYIRAAVESGDDRCILDACRIVVRSMTD